MSHPSRVRGLKLNSFPPGGLARIVAPLAGAWIETFPDVPDSINSPVAPLAGAWIET